MRVERDGRKPRQQRREAEFVVDDHGRGWWCDLPSGGTDDGEGHRCVEESVKGKEGDAA
jgi:hypothetical protein